MQVLTGEYPYSRPRRNRKNEFSRRLSCENSFSVNNLVLPLFITAGKNIKNPISSMPNVFQLSLDNLLFEVEELAKLEIPAIAPFPHINQELKSLKAEYAYNPEGLVPNAIRLLKKEFPQMGIFMDIALDPYTSHGQDGVIDDNGYIINDDTVEILIKQALVYAEAGVDFVAPSDMMDGRIIEIRKALENKGFVNTGIMAYSAKYASSFYGPFRDAIGSAANLGAADKFSYQMHPANSNEALREIALDIQEGADFVMVKPAMPYLDIIQRAKEQFGFPLAAYQVSGEYAMLEAAFKNNWLNREKIIIESLLAISRAGATMIFSYFAKDAAKLLQQGSITELLRGNKK